MDPLVDDIQSKSKAICDNMLAIDVLRSCLHGETRKGETPVCVQYYSYVKVVLDKIPIAVRVFSVSIEKEVSTEPKYS